MTSDGGPDLQGGFGGGVDLVFTGAGLGSGDVDHTIEICGQPCDVRAHDYASVTCRSRPLLTPELLELHPGVFEDADLQPHADILKHDGTEAWKARAFFDDDISEEVEITISQCQIGLQMDSYALLTELRFRGGTACRFGLHAR